MSETKTRRRLGLAEGVMLQIQLVAGQRTYEQLRAATGLSHASVARWVSRMRELKQVHIAGYAEDARGRPFVPLFAWGSADDAPRPGQRRTPAERMAALRAERKKQ